MPAVEEKFCPAESGILPVAIHVPIRTQLIAEFDNLRKFPCVFKIAATTRLLFVDDNSREQTFPLVGRVLVAGLQLVRGDQHHGPSSVSGPLYCVSVVNQKFGAQCILTIIVYMPIGSEQCLHLNDVLLRKGFPAALHTAKRAVSRHRSIVIHKFLICKCRTSEYFLASENSL
jgi:hypothetical protein